MDSEKVYKKIILILAAVIVMICLASVLLFVRLSKNAKKLQSENEVLRERSSQNEKVAEVRALVDEVFIGEIDEDYMTDQLCDGIVAGINDEWSYYLTAEEYASYIENVTNSYVGVGITIRLIDESNPGFTVIEVSPDSPAEKAGVKPGDVLVAVAGESAAELGMDETKNRVRGEAGTDVTVTFRRDGDDREVTMTRASVRSINVTSELLQDNIGYIHIKNFEQDCAKDTIQAINDLKQQGAEALIFDVRFNPGGRKTELVELLDYLLPAGDVFRSERYNGQKSVDTSDAACVEMPMSVLVNVDSYSAAEFFAAALQEYDWAEVVGTQTYGKGYFQQCFELKDGSAVNVSTGKYFTPQGKSLAGVGITPDRVVEVSEEEYIEIYLGDMAHEDDPQLQAAIEAVSGR